MVLLCAAGAQQSHPPTHGVIYGRAVDRLGRPARGVTLDAYPLDAIMATALPQTSTDRDGRYRFNDIPWWGRFAVVPDDPKAGYSEFATGAPLKDGRIQDVTLSPQHPQAESNFQLPPKGGFLQLHLTDKNTGENLVDFGVVLNPADSPDKPAFSGGSIASHTVLIPPDRNFLLHVDANGYQEWERSAGRGFPIRISSGERRILDISLAPKP